jgi:hypothetical protein
LLILTDWQPRALHFPPSDEEDLLLDQSFVQTSASAAAGRNKENQQTGDYDNPPAASWMEPSWRADRMSWMLLGLAQHLAFELGVFDDNHLNCVHQHGPGSECARKFRLQRLLLVYVTQTSGRMGVKSSLHIENWASDEVWANTSKTQDGTYGETGVDVMQKCWVGIAKLMSRANREVFSSKEFTRELISSGRYKQSIASFQPWMQEWKTMFEESKSQINPLMQTMLLMEYEYGRLYINSLGLQAVVESWVGGGSTMGKHALARTAEDNKVYIHEVTEAALGILKLVLDGFAANGVLRDAPVRTYLRTMSAMMFTLKVSDHAVSCR